MMMMMMMMMVVVEDLAAGLHTALIMVGVKKVWGEEATVMMAAVGSRHPSENYALKRSFNYSCFRLAAFLPGAFSHVRLLRHLCYSYCTVRRSQLFFRRWQ